MAAVIRLKRIGGHKRACYRIVVTEKQNPRDGRFVEELGTYDPKKSPPFVTVNEERAKYWLGTGAKPSATVKTLFRKKGIAHN